MASRRSGKASLKAAAEAPGQTKLGCWVRQAAPVAAAPPPPCSESDVQGVGESRSHSSAPQEQATRGLPEGATYGKAFLAAVMHHVFEVAPFAASTPPCSEADAQQSRLSSDESVQRSDQLNAAPTSLDSQPVEAGARSGATAIPRKGLNARGGQDGRRADTCDASTAVQCERKGGSSVTPRKRKSVRSANGDACAKPKAAPQSPRADHDGQAQQDDSMSPRSSPKVTQGSRQAKSVETDSQDTDRAPDALSAAKTNLGGLSLRERLAQRASPHLKSALPGASSDERCDGMGPQLDLEPPHVSDGHHKTLGGMALRWRLAFSGTPGEKAAKRSRRNEGEETSPGAAEITPERCAMQAATLFETPKTQSMSSSPATPVPRKSTPKETPTPLASQHVRGDTSARSHQNLTTPVTPASRSGRKRKSAGSKQSTPTSAKQHESPQSELSGKRNPTSAEQQESPNSEFAGDGGKSITELKELLCASGVDVDIKTDKEDLEDMWERLCQLRAKTLKELRALCYKMPSARSAGADECIRFLMRPRQPKSEFTPPQRQRPSPWPLQPEVKFGDAPTFSASSSSPAKPEAEAACNARASGDPRVVDAETEASRVLRLNPRAFSSRVAWGFAVLGLCSERGRVAADATAVQRAYRGLMRKLHPDRAGASKAAADALEKVHEAKSVCELATSRREPPGAPQNPRALLHTGAVTGCRRLGLQWGPPAKGEHDDVAPVSRYVVAAFDPAYGRTVTVAVLEPDYSENLGRFVPIEELRSYVLVEDELGKLSGLFRQHIVTLQVAAANEAGQSPWTTLQVPVSSSTLSVATGTTSVSHGISMPRAARRSAGRQQPDES